MHKLSILLMSIAAIAPLAVAGQGGGAAQAQWTQFQPSADTKVVYVSQSQGSDSNSGLLPDDPVQSLQAGYNLLRDGFPDWMLLRRGDVWNDEPFPQWKKAGRSPNERMLVGSYGDDDDRPRINTAGSTGFNIHTEFPFDFIALTDFHLTPDPRSIDQEPTGIRMVGGGKYITIENCRIERFRNNLSVQGWDGEIIENLSLRYNIITDSYAADSHSQGAFFAKTDTLIIEHCLFDHNGWHESIGGAEATIFNHNIYVDVSCTNVVARGNIIARASSHGMQARSGGIVENNLFLRNALALSFGVVRGTSSQPLPGGVGGAVRDNIVNEARDITSSLPRGYGFEIGNIKSGAGVHVSRNVLLHDDPAGSSGIGLFLDGTVEGGITDLLLDENIIYDWHSSIRLKGEVGDLIRDVTMTDCIIEGFDDVTELIECVDETDGDELHFANNVYFSTREEAKWYRINTVFHDFSSWVATIDETGSAAVQISFPDDSRSIATYHASIGGSSSLEAFLNEARQQSKKNWRPEYSPFSAAAYVRAGFIVDHD